MAFTHSVGTNYCDNAGTVINLTETLTGQTAAINIDAVIPTEQTQEFDAAISVAKVQSLMICSDQPGMVQTNDPNTPQDTINLRANVPVIWTINSFWPCVFRVDVSKLFLTNTGPAAANTKIRLLSN
jgi:hypothetical protein